MSEYPKIPGYRIEKKLGEGGMAAVFSAIWIKQNKRVAIKVLDPQMLKEKSFEKRFLKEAETVAGLSHPNIISVYDIGKTGNTYYIVMELLDKSLKELLNSGKKGNSSFAVNIIKQIAYGLDFSHSKKVIHRDIKPENIMFRTDGTPVIVDFGIAKTLDSSTKLTKTGLAIGTPHYMSPEQIKGNINDTRSDIYCLGVLFYEILTGNVPYKGPDTISIAMKHVQDPVPLLPKKFSGFQPFLNKAMAKDINNRFKTCREMIDYLEVGETGTSDRIKLKNTELLDELNTKSKKIKKESKEKKLFQTSEIGENNRRRTLVILSSILVILTGILVFYLFFYKTEKVEIEWIKVKSGSFYFTAGQNSSFDSNGKSINISEFFISKFEVSFLLYDKFCDDMNLPMISDNNWGRGNRPVINVSWNDAIKFCKWISKKNRELITLPTEAQWEYAAKGGVRSRGLPFSGSNDPDQVAWYKNNSNGMSMQVGKKESNELGIVDMNGNVWEWCSDFYSFTPLKNILPKDPKGPNTGSNRVLRGGSWKDISSFVGNNSRFYEYPDKKRNKIGFRIVKVIR